MKFNPNELIKYRESQSRQEGFKKAIAKLIWNTLNLFEPFKT